MLLILNIVNFTFTKIRLMWDNFFRQGMMLIDHVKGYLRINLDKKGDKMKNLTLSLLIVLLSAIFAGCAATYKAPEMTPLIIEENVNGSKVKLFVAAKKVLINEGFAIKYSDENRGTISTSPKTLELDDTMANCGTTAGVPALSSLKISGKIALDLVTDNNKVSITASVYGKDVRRNADVTCISTGAVEKDLIQKITIKMN